MTVHPHLPDETGQNRPLLIACEGSGQRAHSRGTWNGICAMCGEVVAIAIDGKAQPHQREDIIAMLERGDFDA